jgi:DnaJ-class molecular chaperone
MVNVEMDIQFEHECFKCYGRGTHTGSTCLVCDGTGRLLTDLGERLMEFLEHQGFTRTQPRKDGEG